MFAPLVDGQRSPKSRPHGSGVYSQAKQLQSLLIKAANCDETTPSALAQVARAFADLEDLKLRIRMKPAPKPVDVTDLARSKQRKPATRGFTETPQDKPAKPGPAKDSTGPVQP